MLQHGGWEELLTQVIQTRSNRRIQRVNVPYSKRSYQGRPSVSSSMPRAQKPLACQALLNSELNNTLLITPHIIRHRLYSQMLLKDSIHNVKLHLDPVLLLLSEDPVS